MGIFHKIKKKVEQLPEIVKGITTTYLGTFAVQGVGSAMMDKAQLMDVGIKSNVVGAAGSGLYHGARAVRTGMYKVAKHGYSIVKAAGSQAIKPVVSKASSLTGTKAAAVAKTAGTVTLGLAAAGAAASGITAGYDLYQSLVHNDQAADKRLQEDYDRMLDSPLGHIWDTVTAKRVRKQIGKRIGG